MQHPGYCFPQFATCTSKWLAALLVSISCCLSTSLFALDQGISASGGWIRETPPGSQNAAAFITIENHGNTARQLVGVQCEASVAARCELHEHITVDGRMRMQKVSSIDIPANGKVPFAPGGFHIMLINIARPLKAGSTVGIVFIFADQSSYSAQLPVKAISQE